MITVVSESAEHEFPINENAFPGMTLAEAWADAQVQVSGIVNEMNMEILLSEHSYLYENGDEVSYVNEDGTSNENAKNVKAIISQKVEEARSVICRLWDKLIAWVIDHMNQLRNAIVKAGLNGDKFKKLVDAVYAQYPEFNLELHQNCVVDYDKFKNDSNNAVDRILSNIDYAYATGANDSISKDNVFKDCIENDQDVSYDANEIKKAADYILTGNKEIINNIKRYRKDTNDTLSDFKKEQKKANGDDMTDCLDRANAAIKANNAVVRDAIRVYHAFITEQVNIIRGFLRTKEAKAVAHPHVTNASNNISNHIADAKKNVNDMKERHKAAKAAKEEKVEEAADLYDGKFFRV